MASKKKQKPRMVRVKTGGDLKSITSRQDRCVAISSAMPTSALCQSYPAVKTALTALLAAGVASKVADDAVAAAELALATARDTRDTKDLAYDTCYGVAVSTIEMTAKTPADVTGTGFIPSQDISYDMAMPILVSASYDQATSILDVYVKHAPGMRACIVEIGTDPNGPTWAQIKGLGAKRSLPGYPPGTYWVRAASARGNEQSAFTAPVAVVVK